MKRSKPTIKKLLIIFAVFIILFSAWMAWGNFTVGLNKITVKSSDLPEGFDGYRIAQVSDLHNATFGKNNSMLIKLLEKSKPDIIVITGDIIDSRRTDVEVSASFAESAAKIAPCYYVTGNHEARVKDDYLILEKRMKDCGITVLRDESVFLEKNGDKIRLIGVDDPSFTKLETGRRARTIDDKLGEISQGEGYKILLSHRPEIFSVYVKHDIDLVFSGHAHGGQFRIPFIGGVAAPNQGWFPQYDAGLYHKNDTDMIVSRGIGNSYIPVRVNNRPEIIIASLEKGE